jgi:tRNA threonylcarbamoyladenosine biosynthesis protein TsaB
MLLAVDTSTRVIGVALYNGIQVISEVSWMSGNHHTIELAPMVSTVLNHTNVDSSELTAVGVAIGPGSFTGLRIGLAFAKGLAFSKKIPIIGIPTLDVLVSAQPVSDLRLAGVLEAGRKRLAIGWYHEEGGGWTPSGKMENLDVDTFFERLNEPTLVCGELNGDIRERLADIPNKIVVAPPAQSMRRPAILAELAWKRLSHNKIDNPSSLQPIYLHHGEPIPG